MGTRLRRFTCGVKQPYRPQLSVKTVSMHTMRPATVERGGHCNNQASKQCDTPKTRPEFSERRDKNGKLVRVITVQHNTRTVACLKKKCCVASHGPGRKGGRKEGRKESITKRLRKMLRMWEPPVAPSTNSMVAVCLLALTHLPFLGGRKSAGVDTAKQVPVQQAAIHAVLGGGVHQGRPVCGKKLYGEETRRC